LTGFNDIIGKTYSIDELINDGFKEFIHPFNNKPVFTGNYKLFNNCEYFVYMLQIDTEHYKVEHCYIDNNYNNTNTEKI